MSNLKTAASAVSALVLVGILCAQQPASPGEVVQGVIHRAGDERFRLAFATSGTAFVEVSGVPADCAFQVGSQGFQESDTSPADWTDGRPGDPVRHTFRVQAGRPGSVWVMLRSRVSGVSSGDWSGVACSARGPYYTTPERGGSGAAAPASFEGRAVRGPIAFRLVARPEGTAPAGGNSRGKTAQTGADSEEEIAAEYRALLPALLQAEKKPWHTRFEFIANTVKIPTGYRVNYKTYCLIEKGPDAGKDHACFEFDSVLDLAALKAGVADMKRRLGR